MHLQILYPSNPLRPREPDDLYAEEYAASVAAGLEASLFSFEDFLAGNLRVRPTLTAAQMVLYRGWMLTPRQYVDLHAGIQALGGRMLTSPVQYERCHYLPGWYSQLREFTPETLFFSEADDIAGRLTQLGWTGCFLKDYVKSLSAGNGSVVKDLRHLPDVLSQMRTFRGRIEGGLCARQLEDLMQETEERYFVFQATAYSRQGTIPEVVQIAAKRVQSPFFTVDTALRRDGVLRIIELGDGQVSDRKEWPAQRLVQLLGRLNW